VQWRAANIHDQSLWRGHNSEELVSRTKEYPAHWDNASYDNTGDQVYLLILVVFQVVFASLALLASLVFHSWTLLIALWALALYVLAIARVWQKTDYRLYLKFHEAIPRQSRRVHYCGQHDVVFVVGGVKTRPPEKWGELIETESRLEVSGRSRARQTVVAWVAGVSLFIQLAALPGLLLYWAYGKYGVPGIIGLSIVLVVLAIGGYRLYRSAVNS